MVHHGVNDDPGGEISVRLLTVYLHHLHHTHPVTSVDHVDELLPVAGPGGVQLVGDRLVPGPPGPALDVLHGRRHLHTTEALRAENFGALVSHGVPGPFKQVNYRLLGVLTVGLSVAMDSHSEGENREDPPGTERLHD